MWQKSIFLFLLTSLFLCSCKGDKTVTTSQPKGELMNIQVTSPAFADKQPIPINFSGLAENISPAIKWTAGPAGTKSYAFICDDPDAPMKEPFVHWVIYSIPAEVTTLAEAVPTTPTLPSGAIQGKNGSGRIGYTGPRPPSGVHRYFFKVYALDAKLDLAPGATKTELLSAMEGHILAQGVLMGTFAHR